MRSKSSSRAALPPALALVAACCVSASFAFAPAPTRRHVARLNRCAAANGDVVGGDGGDDDDSFDPLRSPHEYPGGIDAGAAQRQSPPQSAQSDDVFDPFLTSPHDFPSAMAPPSPGAGAAAAADDVEDDDWSPLRNAMRVERFDDADAGSSRVRLTSGWAVPSAGTGTRTRTTRSSGARTDPVGSNTGTRNAGSVGSGDDFDPLLSPHEYSRGIDAGTAPTAAGTTSATATTPSTATASAKVGVLLIDHGSRRSASNDRLVELAAAYQRAAPPNYVVAAAHMEIAPPTIEDGIRTLLAADDGGLTRIVCHPYFLSPGRHVTEDIPQLVAEAVAAVGRPDVEVATTEPVGSGLDVMVAAIGGLVDATVREMEMGGGGDRQEGGDPEAGRGGDEYRLGGFFGEVQRMVDEQLD